MGFALCALFDAFFPLNDVISAPVDKTFGLRAHVIALGGDMLHRHYSSDIFFRQTSGVCHIWLLYLSRDSWFATVGNGECNQIEVTFENYGPRLNVWNCGVNLVYEQDVEETSIKQLHNATVATSLLEREVQRFISFLSFTFGDTCSKLVMCPHAPTSSEFTGIYFYIIISLKITKWWSHCKYYRRNKIGFCTRIWTRIRRLKLYS
ncbi:hypothetical protein CMV_018518 [Castanea mollissima]|uniref:Uncharacterized protein n=1 Tax=Castanea mollissima TaxID=60419 RepID=A0A8J4QR69_9ROSI|nr:hypothetical protein CMV_018518 [Castanea mollissima]